MSSRLIGNQTGPRQFELPPNIPLVDSAGSYCTWCSAPSTSKMYGMVEMPSRHRADPVRAEETLLVEHPGEDAPQLVLVDQ